MSGLDADKVLVGMKNYSYATWTERFPDWKIDLRRLLNVDSSWNDMWEQLIYDEKWTSIRDFLRHCHNTTEGKIKIFPPPDLVFNAFRLTPLNDVKVVILGQDPYPRFDTQSDFDETIVPQAMGLSFSVPYGMPVPSSLDNVYKNMVSFDILKKQPTHGNLESWAWQGVLLLNRALTVQYRYAGSHVETWGRLTGEIMRYISDHLDNVVFMLWGGPAQDSEEFIDSSKHKVIKSSHPSGRGCWSTCRGTPPFMKKNHFGEANQYLKSVGKKEINWGAIQCFQES